MKKKTLKEMLAGEYNTFMNYIANGDIQKFSEEDQEYFFINAPDKWIFCFMRRYPPKPKAERILVRDRSQSLIDEAQYWWGIDTETQIWAFETQSVQTCEKLINSFGLFAPSEVEKAMLKRCDVDVLKIWLNKINSLSEDGERMLEENLSMSALKSFYIEQQIK